MVTGKIIGVNVTKKQLEKLILLIAPKVRVKRKLNHIF
jgi:hypothetical protein